MARFAVKDELLDAQALRTAECAPYGGADIGACLGHRQVGSRHRPGQLVRRLVGNAEPTAGRGLVRTPRSAGRAGLVPAG